MSGRVPAPLEWHPAYAHMTHLLDWLKGIGSYRDMHLRVPVSRSLTASFATSEDEMPLGPSITFHTLTRHRCAGGAPYVGRPFKYVWTVGIDDLGRAIASDAERWYNPEDEYLARCPDVASLPQR